MNLLLFYPGMQTIIVVCLAVFAGAAVAIFLLKYKFKHPVIRKCLTILILAIAGLVLAYILFYTISNAIGRAKVESRLAEMRTQGIPLDKDSVLPKMPEKNADNGAFFYKAAFELLQVSPSYEAHFDLILRQSALDITTWPEQDRNAAQQLLKNKDMELILSLFRQGAEKPYAVYKREYRGYATELPELNSQRNLLRLVCMKSSAEGLNGNPDAGYSLVLGGFKTIKQFESEPFPVSQLVNMACTSQNIDAMTALISRYGISRQNAEQLLSELDQFDFEASMIHAMDGEILICRDLFEKFMTGHKFDSIEKGMIMEKLEFYSPPYPKEGMVIVGVKFFLSAFFNIEKEILLGRLNFLLPVCPFFYQDDAYYLEQEVKIRMLYSKPYWIVEKEMKELNDESSNTPPQYLISAILFEPYRMVSYRTKTANIESEIDAAKLTLALHVYKNQHGVFPDTLGQLAPEILKDIPVDPISGKPFEYRKIDKAFTISSVWLKEKEERIRQNAELHKRNKGGK